MDSKLEVVLVVGPGLEILGSHAVRGSCETRARRPRKRKRANGTPDDRKTFRRPRLRGLRSSGDRLRPTRGCSRYPALHIVATVARMARVTILNKYSCAVACSLIHFSFSRRGAVSAAGSGMAASLFDGDIT